MHWYGLPTAQLLGVAAVAGGAVVALYILKLRRRPVAVAFSKLWRRILRDDETTSLFSQLKRIVSLLVQLALLALLLVALGDPRGFASRSPRNIVVLLDASASMKATDVATVLAPGRRRIDVALEEAKKLVLGLSDADRMLIAQMDAQITPASTLTSDIGELEAAIGRIRATDTRADFAEALRYASDVLAGLPSPEIVVISDGKLGPSGDALGDAPGERPKVSFVPVGGRGRNVAITEFSVRRYPFDRDRYEVLLELKSTSDRPEDVELTLVGDGGVVDVTRLRVLPGERLSRVLPNLTGAKRTIEASIVLGDGHDDLPADDHAYALLPQQRRIRVACVTNGNTYLEAALLVASYLDVTFVAPGAYPRGAHGSFDVTIFDGVGGPVGPSAGALLYLNPPPEGALVKADVQVWKNVGFDTIDRKNRLLKYGSLEDVYIGRAHRLLLEPGDRVLGASEKGALLIAGRRGAHRFVALGFDPRESDFVLRIAWPLFVLDVLDDFAAEDPSYVSGYRTGETWRVPLPSPAAEVFVVPPSGGRRKVLEKDAVASFFGTEAGFYSVEMSSGTRTSQFEIAANLIDEDESDIAPKASLEVGGRAARPPEGFGGQGVRRWWILLLLLAVGVTAAEWVTYHRRITV
jgi:hypothetical protein